MKKYLLLAIIAATGTLSYGQPVLSTISAYSGNPGSSITITGTGFNATPSNNAVFFGPVKGNVTSASSTSLTVSVPLGAAYKPISVCNLATKLTGYATKPFLPTFDNSLFVADTVNIEGALHLDIADNFIDVLVSDIDGDGKPDMIVNTGFYVSFYRNTATKGFFNATSFAPKVDFSPTPTGYYNDEIAFEDMNGDGKPDLIVCNANSNGLQNALVSICINTSTSGTIDSSSFAPRVDFLTPIGATRLKIADIDGDGKPDIVFKRSARISVLRNTMSGGILTPSSFTTRMDFPGVNFGSTQFTVGDVDGDGKQDVVVLNGGVSFSVFRNTSSSGSLTAGSFAPKVDYTLPGDGIISSVQLNDIDGDGKLDLMYCKEAEDVIKVWRNESSPGTINLSSFVSLQNFPADDEPNDMAFGDLYGNHRADMAVSNNNSNSISILRKSSTTGTFDSTCYNTKVSVATGPEPLRIKICDMDGDGISDVLLGRGLFAGAYVSIYRNSPIQPSPISGVTQLCAGGDTTILSNPTMGGTWSSGDTSIATVGATTGIVTSIADGMAMITYSYSGGMATKAVWVKPLAGSTTGPDELCQGGSINLYNSVDSGIWNSSDTTIASINSSGKVTGISGGTVTLTYTMACGSPATKLVSINALPAAITGTFTVNIGATTALTSATPAGTWSSYDTSVLSIDALGIATGIKPGSSRVTYQLGTGCKTSQTVLINSVTGPAPTISSFSPSVAIPGASATITGTNFNITATNNTVYFGATKATVSSASSTSLNVTVPPGASFKQVSVNDNISARGAYSRNAFLPTFNGSPYMPIFNFDSSVNFETNDYAAPGIAMADMDGDGKADLVLADPANKTVTIRRNISTTGSITNATFAAPVKFPITPTFPPHADGSPNCLAIGDLDGDGKPDIAIANIWFHCITVLRNTSIPGIIDTLSLSKGVNFATDYRPVAVTIFDADRDGKLDLAAANSVVNNVSVLRNTGGCGYIDSTSFAAKVNFTSGSSPSSITNGDVDGDGKNELIIGNSGSGFISVLRNTATPGTISSSSFAAKVDFSSLVNVSSIWFADIDGDGKSDVVTNVSTTPYISVHRNTATPGAINSGSFATRVTYGAGSNNGGEMFIADMNGDNKPDVITSNSSSYSIYKNTATPGTISATSFAAKVNVGYYGYGFCVGDVDGDFKPDIVNSRYHFVSVFRNRPLMISLPIRICVGNTKTVTHVTTGGTWSSSNTATATIGTTTGVVTGIGVGTARLTYWLPGGGYDTTSVTVTTPPSAISGISSACHQFLGWQIFTNAVPGGTWSTSNNNLEIDQMGFASHNAAGNVVISYSLGCTSPVTKNVNIYPTPEPITGITSLYPSSSTTLTTTPAGGVWSSSNTAVATISTGGLFSAISTGTAIISYTLATGSCRATQLVTVYPTIVMPVITSVSPIVAIPGATITITGTNFNTNPDSNFVYFGATRATISSASSTSLSAILPIGCTYMPVSVYNASPDRIGYSRFPVLPKYDNAAYISGSVNFEPKVNVTSGNFPNAVAIDDMDGDGKADVVVANWTSKYVSVYRNVATSGVINTSSLASKVDFVTDTCSWDVAISDIDGDGKKDIIVSSNHTKKISIFRNISTTGSITSSSFASRVDYSSGAYGPRSLSIADLDGDGKPDITTGSDNGIFIWRNISSPGTINSSSLATMYFYSTVSPAVHIVTSDIDGDGKTDILLASDSLVILRNTSIQGYLYFAAPKGFGASYTYNGFVVGDLDGDGKPDVAAVNATGGTNHILVLRNTATSGSITSSSFAPFVTFATGSLPQRVAIADYDGDGKPDITTSDEWDNSISVLRNTSTPDTINSGSFAAFVSFPVNNAPTALAAGDIDGDKKADLVVANSTSNNICVLRNNPVLTVPAITGTMSTCIGGASALSHATSGGTWLCSNTAIATVGSTTGIISGVANGTANITYLHSGGASIVTCTISGSVSAGVISGGTTSICPSVTTTLSNTVSGGAWSSSTPAVATVGSTGIVTGVSLGTATISYSVTSGGCTGVAIRVVTVNLSAVAGTITGSPNVCVGGTSALTNATAGGVWSSSTPTIATIGSTGIVTGISAGTSSISYTVTNTCGTAVASITVTVATTTGAGIITGTANVCVSGTSTFSNTVTGGTWSSGNIAIATIGSTGIVTGVSAGTAIISYAVTSSCGSATTTKIVTVNTTPLAGTITGASIVNTGSTIALSNTVSGGTWSVSNSHASVSSGGMVTGISTGTVIISYLVSSSCGSASATKVVTVSTPPLDTITGTLIVCAGITTTLSNTVTGGTWSSSNTSVATIGASTGVVAALSVGTAIITYSLAGSYVTATLTVSSTIAGITGATLVCIGSTTTFTHPTPGGSWASSNTAMATIDASSGIITGMSSGTPVMTYTIGACFKTKSITVNAGSGGSITGITTMCVGNSSVLSYPASGISWTSTNPSVATIGITSGVVTGVSAGTSLISFLGTSGCGTSAIVTILPLPTVISGALTLCQGTTTTLASVGTTGGTWASSTPSKASVGSLSGIVIINRYQK